MCVQGAGSNCMCLGAGKIVRSEMCSGDMQCGSVCTSKARVQAITWGTSGLCAHVHTKGDRVHWNWLVVAWDS